VLARGFALVRDAAGQPLFAAAAITPGDLLDIEFSDGRVGARAQATSPAPVADTRASEKPAMARKSPRRRDDQGDLF